MTQPSREELLACPFCGGTPYETPSGPPHGSVIRCGSCSARTVSDYAGEAAKEWNCRAREWECMGRKQSLPEPGDCNWPYCGCDAHATKVIESLLEQGWHDGSAQSLPPEFIEGELTPEQIFIINDMVNAWIDDPKRYRQAFRQDCKRLLASAALPASSGEVRAELPPHYAFPLRVEGDSIKDANGSYVCDFSSIHGWKARNEMVAFIVAATNAYALKSPSSSGKVRDASPDSANENRVAEDSALIANVREATIEECAKVAKAHKGAARKKRQGKGKLYYGSEAMEEILAEERGEDIASEIIEREIRALKSPSVAVQPVGETK